MGFASAYLEKKTIGRVLVKEEALPGTGIIIIVPCFDEPSISHLLDSLSRCETPDCPVEVIVGVNAPPSATQSQEEQNRVTIKDLKSWKQENKVTPFRLFYFDAGISIDKGWGAGSARKLIMDEAVSRFDSIDNPGGIIVSLDADCTVSTNYLVTLYDRFSSSPGVIGASIRFEHIIPGIDEEPLLRKAIIAYELHMRYYYQALKYTGYPYVFHTIGSALAARAAAYVKVGGMNRRQAGEDFYFIQKMIPLGGFIEINDTAVYPSPRTSARVPFGTGPAVRAIMENPGQQFFTYDPRSFTDLRILVEMVPSLWEYTPTGEDIMEERVPAGLSKFLKANEWLSRVDEARSNTSSQDSFIKRFYNWFNMFQVVKYLNFVHTSGDYKKIAVEEASLEMLRIISGIDIKDDNYKLLARYRMLER